MKRLIICLLAFCLLLTGCGAAKKSSDETIHTWEYVGNIEDQFREAIPYETSGWLRSTDNPISVNEYDQTLEFSVFVAVMPDVIPMVAESVIPIVQSLAQEHGYEKYELAVMFYVEDGKSAVWVTKNGHDGLFTETGGKSNGTKTLDEVYEYYDNFGRNQESESGSEESTK